MGKMGRGFCAIRSDDTSKRVFGKRHVSASLDGNDLALFNCKYKRGQIFHGFASTSPILHRSFSESQSDVFFVPPLLFQKPSILAICFSSVSASQNTTLTFGKPFSEMQTSTAMTLLLDPVYPYPSISLLKISKSQTTCSSPLSSESVYNKLLCPRVLSELQYPKEDDHHEMSVSFSRISHGENRCLLPLPFSKTLIPSTCVLALCPTLKSTSSNYMSDLF
jgi:hypothetical protein